ncbi:hypothetical protein ScPMuIL_002776 [Solemya velum]
MAAVVVSQEVKSQSCDLCHTDVQYCQLQQCQYCQKRYCNSCFNLKQKLETMGAAGRSPQKGVTVESCKLCDSLSKIRASKKGSNRSEGSMNKKVVDKQKQNDFNVYTSKGDVTKERNPPQKGSVPNPEYSQGQGVLSGSGKNKRQSHQDEELSLKPYLMEPCKKGQPFINASVTRPLDSASYQNELKQSKVKARSNTIHGFSEVECHSPINDFDALGTIDNEPGALEKKHLLLGGGVSKSSRQPRRGDNFQPHPILSSSQKSHITPYTNLEMETFHPDPSSSTFHNKPKATFAPDCQSHTQLGMSIENNFSHDEPGKTSQEADKAIKSEDKQPHSKNNHNGIEADIPELNIAKPVPQKAPDHSARPSSPTFTKSAQQLPESYEQPKERQGFEPEPASVNDMSYISLTEYISQLEDPDFKTRITELMNCFLSRGVSINCFVSFLIGAGLASRDSTGQISPSASVKMGQGMGRQHPMEKVSEQELINALQDLGLSEQQICRAKSLTATFSTLDILNMLKTKLGLDTPGTSMGMGDQDPLSILMGTGGLGTTGMPSMGIGGLGTTGMPSMGMGKLGTTSMSSMGTGGFSTTGMPSNRMRGTDIQDLVTTLTGMKKSQKEKGDSTKGGHDDARYLMALTILLNYMKKDKTNRQPGPAMPAFLKIMMEHSSKGLPGSEVTMSRSVGLKETPISSGTEAPSRSEQTKDTLPEMKTESRLDKPNGIDDNSWASSKARSIPQEMEEGNHSARHKVDSQTELTGDQGTFLNISGPHKVASVHNVGKDTDSSLYQDVSNKAEKMKSAGNSQEPPSSSLSSLQEDKGTGPRLYQDTNTKSFSASRTSEEDDPQKNTTSSTPRSQAATVAWRGSRNDANQPLSSSQSRAGSTGNSPSTNQLSSFISMLAPGSVAPVSTTEHLPKENRRGFVVCFDFSSFSPQSHLDYQGNTSNPRAMLTSQTKLDSDFEPNVEEYSLAPFFNRMGETSGMSYEDMVSAMKKMVMNVTQSGFLIRDTMVSFGDCMFSAAIDQLQLHQDNSLSPLSLRLAAVEFLRKDPLSEDGTHLLSFIEGEEWEAYLTRMSHPEEWGDHIMLQAIANVTGRTIQVIPSDETRDWTVIEPKPGNKTNRACVYLGHVAQSHYVSLRPSDHWNTFPYTGYGNHDDKSKMAPQMLGIDDERKNLLAVDWIDNTCGFPMLHLSYILKRLLTKQGIKDISDKYASCRRAQTMSYGYSLPQTVGSMFEGLMFLPSMLFYPCEKKIQSLCLTFIYVKSTKVITENNEYRAPTDLLVDTSLVHPGYTRLLKTMACYWGFPMREWADTVAAYYPNSYLLSAKVYGLNAAQEYGKPQFLNLFKSFEDDSETMIMDEQHSAFPCAWPKTAMNWLSRQRCVDWPSSALRQEIVHSGCHVIPIAHKHSLIPEVEWRFSFSVAEKKISLGAMTPEQKYCYIVLKGLCSDILQISSGHLKSVFFTACENIPLETWGDNCGGCVLYLIQTLLQHAIHRYLPNYFIPENNMWDDLEEEELENLTEALQNLRRDPLQYAKSAVNSVYKQSLLDLISTVQQDTPHFQSHRNVKSTVSQLFIPLAVADVHKWISQENWKMATELAMEILDERQSIAAEGETPTLEDLIPDLIAGFHVINQWWFTLNVGKTRSIDIVAAIFSNRPCKRLGDVIGEDVAGVFSDLLVPQELLKYLCSFCANFCYFLYHSRKYRTALPILHFCVDKYKKLVATEKTEEYRDFTPETVLTIYKAMFYVYSAKRELMFFADYLQDVEDLVKEIGTPEASEILKQFSEEVKQEKEYFETTEQIFGGGYI